MDRIFTGKILKMKKILVGLLSGAVMLGVSFLIGRIFEFFFPYLHVEYENTNLFRPWSDPIMLIYFIEPFILGIILAWIWDLMKSIIKGNTPAEKGIYFGYIYWVITIPGMLMSFSSFPLSITMVVSWSVALLVQALSSGLIFSKLLK